VNRRGQLWLAVLVLLGACDHARARAPTARDVGPRYYVVGPRPTQTLGRKAFKLLPGFGVVIEEQRNVAGEMVGRTSLGRDLPMKDLRPVTPSSFTGVFMQGRTFDFGWVVREGAAVREQPSSTSRQLARYPLYARLRLNSHSGPEGYWRLAEGWMASDDLRVPRLSSPPLGVAPDEPWIDVELESQTLVAYRGAIPVLATLISTGVGAPGTAFETPPGLHRVRAKLLAATMDNLTHQGVVPYSYEEVPHTQYIGRVALHGAFWHDQFGHRRSHGCINLSVTDAEWLFSFTRPALPKGEHEISASNETGTMVRVR